VSRYRGDEIPNADELGLDPRRTYAILRPLEELRKALPLFNSMPLLSEHTPVSASDHKPDLVIGSTGTDAQIVGDAVTNSLVIWAKDGIDQVESGAAKALSCGYKYKAVARSGNFNGEPYSLVMTAIEPNHLTICPEGRVMGAFVGDSAMKINRYIGKFTNDMSGTTGGIDALCEYLEGKGLTPEELDEVRALMGTDDPEIAADEPEPFPGRPRPGGGMDPIKSETPAMDALGFRAPRMSKAEAGFYARYPMAKRLRGV
jgi:hypothetical protein